MTKLLAATVGTKEKKAIHASNPSMPSAVYSLAYTTVKGSAAHAGLGEGGGGVLLVNKRPSPVTVTLGGVRGGAVSCVEAAVGARQPGFAPPARTRIDESGTLRIGTYGTCVATALQLR